ncbi:MAG: helix-turn-helix domain-containing protein [Mycobacterium sp.]
MNLPVARDGSFRLAGHRWELPDFDNAEDFVARLTRRGVIEQDRTVNAVLHGGRQALSQRSVERHFRRTTGMTQGMFRQIERARYATNLLAGGTPILDVVHEAGYFDQAHLDQAHLKAMIGRSPMAIRRRETQLSFLYKTTPGRLG